jgi:tetratricopeptide (TPR) repeat protein
MKVRYKAYISSLVFGLFVISCSPKVVKETKPEQVKEVAVEPENTGPCTILSQLRPADKDEAETAYVLYRDFYKAKDYKKALPLWEKAYTLAPAANGRIKYQFDDGVGIYKELFKTSADDTEKKSYVETIMEIYDKRAECTGEEGYSAGRKAFDYYYYFKDYIAEEELFELFRKAVDMKGEKSDYFVINPFTSMLFDRVLKEKISHDEGRAYANKIFSAIDYGTTNCTKNCESWEIVNDYAPARLENLEGIEGFYDCTYYSNKYYAIFQANPQDCEVINKTYSRLLYGGCDLTNPYVVEVKNAKQTNCYTPPPQEGPLRRGYNAYSEGRYKEAVDAFEEYVGNATDNVKKAKYALLIAKIYYGDLKNFSISRKKALEAASYRPNWGEPYILIGKLYASSGPLCGPGRGWDSQIVTWPAIDKFKYAKKIDPSVATEANKWINQYRQYMPSKEDVFIRNLKAGSSFKVGCWINESTTIRTAD